MNNEWSMVGMGVGVQVADEDFKSGKQRRRSTKTKWILRLYSQKDNTSMASKGGMKGAEKRKGFERWEVRGERELRIEG
jgi:hypothetical protein